MQRPRYENADTRAVEAALAALIEVKWRCTLFKRPWHEIIDFLAVRNGEPFAGVEVKRRYNAWDRYPDLMVSTKKQVGAMQFRHRWNVPTVLFVEYNHGVIMCASLNDLTYPRGYGGRTDRNDPHDIEEVCRIPMCKMRRVQ